MTPFGEQAKILTYLSFCSISHGTKLTQPICCYDIQTYADFKPIGMSATKRKHQNGYLVSEIKEEQRHNPVPFGINGKTCIGFSVAGTRCTVWISHQGTSTYINSQ